MLKITGLNYQKGFKKILDDINLTIDDNTINIICGENGCGKTTLLKIIVGAIRSKGITNNFSDAFFLSDKFVLPGNRLVSDFLYEAIKDFKGSVNIDNIMADLELPDKPIKTLSKGNYKKVGIIYSFISKAKLVVYDEILDGLSPQVVKKVIKYLKELNKTIILVSHFLKPFRYLNYHLIEMKEGKIINEKEVNKPN